MPPCSPSETVHTSCVAVWTIPSDGSNGYWGFLLLPDVRSILVYVISFVWVFSVIVMAVISACGTLGMLGVCFCLERGLIPFFLELRDFVCTFISSLVRQVILSEWAAPENDFSNGRTPACQRVFAMCVDGSWFVRKHFVPPILLKVIECFCW